ncbi:MAG: hypothetical protein JTT17_06310 [Candidatus Brockarchaeota archaeon]|nr:hypothetical protein [Candidatus Brockarchaeota archaeon]
MGSSSFFSFECLSYAKDFGKAKSMVTFNSLTGISSFATVSEYFDDVEKELLSIPLLGFLPLQP